MERYNNDGFVKNITIFPSGSLVARIKQRHSHLSAQNQSFSKYLLGQHPCKLRSASQSPFRITIHTLSQSVQHNYTRTTIRNWTVVLNGWQKKEAVKKITTSENSIMKSAPDKTSDFIRPATAAAAVSFYELVIITIFLLLHSSWYSRYRGMYCGGQHYIAERQLPYFYICRTTFDLIYHHYQQQKRHKTDSAQ